MGVVNWEIVTKINANNGIDFTSGLSLEGDYCYALEVLQGPSLLAIKNKVVTAKKNAKIKALIRKSCIKMEPFLFLRCNSQKIAYVLKLENNMTLYRLDMTDIDSFSEQDPIVSGTTTINANVSYNISLSCYELLDSSVIVDVEILKNNVWTSEIKHVFMPNIFEGDIGFGNYYRFSNLTSECKRVYFDKIEILTPIDFI